MKMRQRRAYHIPRKLIRARWEKLLVASVMRVLGMQLLGACMAHRIFISANHTGFLRKFLSKVEIPGMPNLKPAEPTPQPVFNRKDEAHKILEEIKDAAVVPNSYLKFHEDGTSTVSPEYTKAHYAARMLAAKEYQWQFK